MAYIITTSWETNPDNHKISFGVHSNEFIDQPTKVDLLYPDDKYITHLRFYFPQRKSINLYLLAPNDWSCAFYHSEIDWKEVDFEKTNFSSDTIIYILPPHALTGLCHISKTPNRDSFAGRSWLISRPKFWGDQIGKFAPPLEINLDYFAINGSDLQISGGTPTNSSNHSISITPSSSIWIKWSDERYKQLRDLALVLIGTLTGLSGAAAIECLKYMREGATSYPSDDRPSAN